MQKYQADKYLFKVDNEGTRITFISAVKYILNVKKTTRKSSLALNTYSKLKGPLEKVR